MGDVAELLLFLPRLNIRLRLRSSSATTSYFSLLSSTPLRYPPIPPPTSRLLFSKPQMLCSEFLLNVTMGQIGELKPLLL